MRRLQCTRCVVVRYARFHGWAEDEKNATVAELHQCWSPVLAYCPVFMICLRKGYGLVQAMAMGSFHVPQFCIAWPTGEFGPMGLEVPAA